MQRTSLEAYDINLIKHCQKMTATIEYKLLKSHSGRPLSPMYQCRYLCIHIYTQTIHIIQEFNLYTSLQHTQIDLT